MLKRIELLISALLALLFLIGYAVYTLLAEISWGHPVGLLLGLLGLILMLMTETLYTLRKRVPWFRMGPLCYWLSFHIITGIVGPWLALLHTAFQFKGWAGLTMLLVVIVFISGFVGRYIYHAKIKRGIVQLNNASF